MEYDDDFDNIPAASEEEEQPQEELPPPPAVPYVVEDVFEEESAVVVAPSQELSAFDSVCEPVEEEDALTYDFVAL
jgi:hypothetical protein